ncbi:disintegrin and metalloproteinase with thrombospondin motifs 7-like protein 1, partial [Leptotrombidium deliense]
MVVCFALDEEDKRNANNEFIEASSIDFESRFIRERRAIQKAKTIETAIFVDKHLHQRFSNNLNELKRLVLAIMSEVQLIYNFRSMKTAIRIVIVKFEVLPLTSEAPNDAHGDIDKYLDNFCEWQARKMRHEARDKRWDHAIMLTGLDLYKDIGNGKKNKKVLGKPRLAWVNGMCKPQYSCTLNEGKSFEASFVIAHEMGHSLGILHDNRNNNCDGDKYIMSEKTGPGKIHWSSCSNAYLEAFLKKGHGMCLENVATPRPELDFTKSHRLPGEQYPPDLQCRLALGSQYKAYRSTKTPFD